MAYKAKNTERTGAERGNSVYWGPKQNAKRESNKHRRRTGKRQLYHDLLS
jgi:hypothetical protein